MSRKAKKLSKAWVTLIVAAVLVFALIGVGVGQSLFHWRQQFEYAWVTKTSYVAGIPATSDNCCCRGGLVITQRLPDGRFYTGGAIGVSEWVEEGSVAILTDAKTGVRYEAKIERFFSVQSEGCWVKFKNITPIDTNIDVWLPDTGAAYLQFTE